MPQLYFETDAGDCPIAFGGATDVLVHFLSFAFAARYGAQHEFTRLSLLLRSQHKIAMTPLLTFADREVEEDADERELERVWQDAAPLAATLSDVLGVLDAPNDEVRALIEDAPDLVPRLRDLERMAAWAAERGARVRLSYDL